MPNIYWIFGPNGVGKTTNAQQLNGGVEHFNLDKIIMDLVEADQPGLINAIRKNSLDTFKQDQFLTHFSNNSVDGATQLENDCMKKIKAQEDFSLESNFLPVRHHPILNAACKNGYNLTVIYIGQLDIEVIKQRVKIRTELTGQFVSEKDILTRYNGGLSDINDLLAKPSNFEFKDNLSQILMFTMPQNRKGLNLIINIEKNGSCQYHAKYIKEWAINVPNLNNWLATKLK